ncbi:MAG: AAA family ATPase [Candidatus Aminicenantes bacterium]|nr:AAA family ATPase [Candidatus Aminicenantes bacterium]NIM82288.1 AAA family ATPase [Candidatus Aminicenantes bacterium]NIN21671.1 AAA family ATPase [Candidatus Aminicenantes bacterium]NIN45480.1 AAA family ATPase [Candidatus Aminicenantes bacterium]NIN88311.1 AAA family ATPase [Candidatus Aminicenantes bacterium]
MIKKAKRYFNTSGHNIPAKHYTLKREYLIPKGLQLVTDDRYFTIWAPRQTGKTTYFISLAQKLESMGFEVFHINLENFKSVTEKDFLEFLAGEFEDHLDIRFNSRIFALFYKELKRIKDRKIVLIIDEIEGLNEEIFGQFLHTIRNLYSFRQEHSLKSVILVGVANIVGVVQDHASPFNIADNLEIPYFTDEETFELLHMHEEETGQQFDRKVKEKIAAITANQPGLVNGFAYQLVSRYPREEVLNYDHYLEIEDWYLTEAIDKNISNIINKAKQHRSFVEMLLFTEDKLKYKINDEQVKFLHSHGLIRKGEEGFVEFWVPLYKKAVYDAFYPFRNGESKEQMREINLGGFFMEKERLDFDKLVEGYRTYVKRRGFRCFREKDKKGRWRDIKEAALVYSFETFMQTLLLAVEGKSYQEPNTGQGRSDLIVNIEGKETVIEFKIYRDQARFEKGKKQVAYYAKSLCLNECVYLVFVSNIYRELGMKDEVLSIDGVTVRCYVIFYDETKDF